MKKYIILVGLLLAISVNAALLTPPEKILLEKVQTQKLTIQQRKQVIAILRKYLAGKKISYKGDSRKILSGLINYLLTQ